MEYNKSTFICNIELLMKQKGIKISELESECSLSQGYFSRFKSSDETAAPNINLIIKLCNIFDVSINMLLFCNIDNLCKHEKIIIKFIDKLCDNTYEDAIHWIEYNMLSKYEDIIKSGITCLLIPNDINKSFRYKTMFNGYRYLDQDSKIYAYKNNNEYYVLCNVKDTYYDSIMYQNYQLLELYYIKNNTIHTIADSTCSNKYISEKLDFLYNCILKEQNIIRIDADVFDAISKY